MDINELRENIKNIKNSKENIFNENLLENYYDDNDWNKFAELFKNIKSENTKGLLGLFNNDIGLVNVIEWRIADDPLNWIKITTDRLKKIKKATPIKMSP